MGLDMHLSIVDLNNIFKEDPFVKEELIDFNKHVSLCRESEEYDLFAVPVVREWLNNKDIANLTEGETDELIELFRANDVLNDFKDYWQTEHLLQGLLNYEERNIKKLHDYLRSYAEYLKKINEIENFDKKLDRYIKFSECIYGNEVEDFYWRKFNALHLWFVKYAQNGKDECMPHLVNLKTLKELRSTLETIDALTRNEYDLENPSEHSIEIASSLLPTGSGFFFGSTDYDKWYFSDVSESLKSISSAIKLLEANDSYVAIYQSSW